jgi:stage V sporulation protein SpoVS
MWSIVLTGGTMLLQAQKKGGASHSAPATHQHSAAPQKQEHTPTLPQRQEHTPTPMHERPSPTLEHPAPHSQGRTFGNHPPQTPRVPNPPARQNHLNPAPAHIGGTIIERAATHSVTTPHGDSIHRSPSGQVREVQLSSGATVYHPPGGPRRVEVVRPGGQAVVARAPGYGYVQRPIVVHNTTIIKRTYMNNGVPTARFYQPRMFNGVALFVYRPVRYYRPAFYRWAYNPWRLPVVYVWGWARSPWYGYYGSYFSPYPMYESPSLWLTDYLIAATLESAYQERMAANSTLKNNDTGGQPITPETKQAIAEEVRRQIDVLRMEQNQLRSSGGSVTTIFSDNAQHVFVANSSYLYNSDAGECTVNEGDVLLMAGAPPANAAAAEVVVLSSRGQDCARGTTVSAPLQDLQEMHNAMVATLDRGLAEMQAKQGRGGMPAVPPGSTGTIDSPYAAEAKPDENVAGELEGVIRETDRAEQEAIHQEAVNQVAKPASTKPTFSTSGAAQPTLVPGLSIDQAKAIQGEPQRIVEFGNRKIFVYRDLKITFTNGRLTDIE